MLDPGPPLTSAQVLQKYGRALVVLPYASIVSEKTEHLSAVLKPMHATVKGTV